MNNKWLHRVIGGACVTFYLLYIYSNFESIPVISINAVNVMLFISAILAGVTGVVLSGFIFYFLLDFKLPLKRSLVIVSISQLGKYIPGNVGQFVGRVFMAKKDNISTLNVVNAMFLDILFAVSTGAIFSVVAFSYYLDNSLLSGIYIVGKLPEELRLILVAVLFLLPWIFITLLRFTPQKIISYIPSLGKIIPPSFKASLFVTCSFACCFLLYGIILKIQLLMFDVPMISSVIELTCLFSIAWLVGYVVPGAPGGLGAREAATILLLAPVVGHGTAIALSIVLRLITTIADFVAFLAGVTINKLSEKT